MKQSNLIHGTGVSSIKVYVTDEDGAAIPFFPTLEQVSAAYVQSVLEANNIEKAARILGISRDKTYRIIKKASLSTPNRGKHYAK